MNRNIPTTNQTTEEQPVLNQFIFPLRPLQQYLLEELPRRNINKENIGNQMVPLMGAVIQETVDDFGVRGISLDEERFTTRRVSSMYLMYDDRMDLVDECQRMLHAGVYGMSEFTYFEYPWYYRLLNLDYLLLKIDKRDLVCPPPSETLIKPTDTPSPSNIISSSGTLNLSHMLKTLD
ncbi:hypothetical protein JOAD_20 [Erwinia phage vB_EamM_Joad]|uniref:Uncharacterized protein n=1 Tax=Erwinia phage vB_EamM_Joad TaxID=2026081 RepID=A0A223LIT7_9CAUD|nr:hypothetical protein JOAD_20 [Erwinia phage vB_EamM_Joad]